MRYSRPIPFILSASALAVAVAVADAGTPATLTDTAARTIPAVRQTARASESVWDFEIPRPRTLAQRAVNRLVRARNGVPAGVPLPEVRDDVYVAHHGLYELLAPRFAGRTIIELGCRTGFGSDTLMRAGASSVLALDDDHGSIAYGRRHFGREGLTFGEGTMPPPDATSDAVVAVNVLQHRGDRTGVIDSARSALRSRGQLVIAVPPGSAPHGDRDPETARAEWVRLLSSRFEDVNVFVYQAHAPLDLSSPFSSSIKRDAFRLSARRTDEPLPADVLAVVYIARRL